mmetsp:Transcript_9668/g.20060  ORF Transcript_9668/g.20060 Transcript_9668/m.20060 type:complete len:306 (+) Transcript_9668:628-1545(+)
MATGVQVSREASREARGGDFRHESTLSAVPLADGVVVGWEGRLRLQGWVAVCVVSISFSSLMNSRLDLRQVACLSAVPLADGVVRPLGAAGISEARSREVEATGSAESEEGRLISKPAIARDAAAKAASRWSAWGRSKDAARREYDPSMLRREGCVAWVLVGPSKLFRCEDSVGLQRWLTSAVVSLCIGCRLRSRNFPKMKLPAGISVISCPLVNRALVTTRPPVFLSTPWLNMYFPHGLRPARRLSVFAQYSAKANSPSNSETKAYLALYFCILLYSFPTIAASFISPISSGRCNSRSSWELVT